MGERGCAQQGQRSGTGGKRGWVGIIPCAQALAAFHYCPARIQSVVLVNVSIANAPMPKGPEYRHVAN